ncbi:GSCFA domain-containing protein [Nitrosomonas communis]|uniref:GSCFA domain-containing protein n=1 Tax=Nitrosomonas communis TaxID=44574 RepID=UPI003D2E4F44
MGSCLAQHLAKNIAKAGFNYFVPEIALPHLSESEATKKNYGIFSARYGNVYTVRQAVQLFDRTFKTPNQKKILGLFNRNSGPSKQDDHIWMKGGSYVDAFRPRIEPDGFSSKEELREDRKRHLRCVRRVFEDSDWLIFTLGLTEAWRSKKDGSIFPLAPGVSGGEFDKSQHEFVNFSFNEVMSDLKDFIRKVKSVRSCLEKIIHI